MDGIQPYPGPSRPPGPQTFSITPTLAKTPSDYIRALRRRVWLVLLVAMPLSVAAAVFTMRMPSVYKIWVQIQIEPPQYDPVLEALVSHGVSRKDNLSLEKYVPNKVAMLRSKVLAERVVNNPELALPNVSSEDAAAELVEGVQTRQLTGSNHFIVSLEGTDPARTAKLLSTLLEVFRSQAKDEVARMIDDSKTFAEDSLKRLKQEQVQLDKQINDRLRASTTIGPGGRNILEMQYLNIDNAVLQKRARIDEMKQQAWVAQLFPNASKLAGTDPDFAARQGMIADLDRQRRQLASQLKQYKDQIRNFNSDPATRVKSRRLDEIMDEIRELKAVPLVKENATTIDPYETMINSMREELRAHEETSKAVLAKFQESMPEHQQFLSVQEERKQKVERINDLQMKLSEFEILARSQNEPIIIPASVPEPSVPIRPKRAMNIALGTILSFVLGIGLVCLLEYLDHSVKVPEHLTIGLTLPLFGVIPRIRRTALTQRGGHLWTPGAPESVEADAYRNLRASLLGATDKRGPIVTLLVTSAKAGEGKSTTALNLAATCARAGERTLLMDVDLRRPSLRDVFEIDGGDIGLVDVLRGDLPWQRSLVRTNIPNLDFLPTGDTREVPIEILGTRELRQLLIALAGHYDRVILDGPAVLGLADCRMLGRFVDAALLVVRSGSHGLQPLQRAKAMLEQSRVTIAGVVFNGLYEDLENWSSYGPYQGYGGPESQRPFGPAAPLPAPATPVGSLSE